MGQELVFGAERGLKWAALGGQIGRDTAGLLRKTGTEGKQRKKGEREEKRREGVCERGERDGASLKNSGMAILDVFAS